MKNAKKTRHKKQRAIKSTDGYEMKSISLN